MPANPEKILQLLIKEGQIAANATPEQKEAAIYDYLQNKMKGGVDDKPNPMASKQLDVNEEALNLDSESSIRGRKLGNSVTVSPSTPQFKPLKGEDKLLLIAVDFAEEGPLYNQIPVPNNSFDLWVPDFSIQHFEDMLFTPGGWTIPADAPRYAGEHRGSMHDYYLEQSYGKYTVDGKAYGWFTVDNPESYYGDDDESGHDNLEPGNVKDLIADAVVKVNEANAIDWQSYDEQNLYGMDADNDGKVDAIDCIIDHPLFIHAGIDQSGGGGAQGNDAIWAHSSSTWEKVAVTEACPDGLYIANYTIMPEDGGVGVFAHEFGHDLGLPDDYDTIYSGRGDSVAYWSLMSSGSWVGRPAQTQPSDISIWGRMSLGWVVNGDNMVRTNLNNLSKTLTTVRLEQSERWGGDGTINAIRVDLPLKTFFTNVPHGGTYEWFGGKADQIDTTLVRSIDLTGKTSASLSFWTWYDIEENWDYGFVQVSTDGGTTWTPLNIDGMTSDIDSGGMPEIAANLPGFTGNSGGWVSKSKDLSEYAGKTILLSFRYMTDWGTTNAGFYLDDIAVTADGTTIFSDDVETEDPAWMTDDWSRVTGTDLKIHYYLMEWRNINEFETLNGEASIVNSDHGLSNVYMYDPYSANPDDPWYFSYNPGLLLWYRDTSYTDNWTGVHPGAGFLLVVDAHPQAMMRPPYLNVKLGGGVLPWNSRVQTYDSTFSLTKALDATLSYWNIVRKNTGLNAVPNFDDSKLYWDAKASANSVITPHYGLIFRVVGQASDGSAAMIGLGIK
jgi:immune inhibitor A